VLKLSKNKKKLAKEHVEPTYEMIDGLALFGVKLTDDGFVQEVRREPRGKALTFSTWQAKQQPLHVRPPREEPQERRGKQGDVYSGVDEKGKIAIRIVDDFGAAPKKATDPLEPIDTPARHTPQLYASRPAGRHLRQLVELSRGEGAQRGTPA